MGQASTQKTNARKLLAVARGLSRAIPASLVVEPYCDLIGCVRQSVVAWISLLTQLVTPQCRKSKPAATKACCERFSCASTPANLSCAGLRHTLRETQERDTHVMV